jgi:hypothetical protein
MSLQRVGGRADGGIDIQGWWWLPPTFDATKVSDTACPSTTHRRLRVLCQCKAEKKKLGPNYVRELEGVMHRYMSLPQSTPLQPASLRDKDGCWTRPYPIVALLMSESPFTKATLLRAQSSPIPFFLLHIPPTAPSSEEEDDGKSPIGAAFWNPALAGVQGLLGGQMEVRWERAADNRGRPGLWWRGKRLRSWTPDDDQGHYDS